MPSPSASPARPDPAIYKANNQALARYRPELLARLEALLPADRTEVVLQPAANGSWTAVARNSADGRTVTLHSTTDPEVEARQLADQAECQAGEVRCLVGLGLGFMAVEIMRRRIPLLKLVVIETSPRVLAAAMQVLDLTELMASQDVSILLGQDPDLAPVLAENHVAILGGGLRVTTYEPARELFPNQCQGVLRRLREDASALTGTITTMKSLGQLALDNVTANATVMMRSANLAVLNGALTGHPAIILGAGPSLAPGIETLRRWPNRAFLVAVDSALPVLLRHGLKPHLVVSVDCTEECFEKFRPILAETEVPLCYASIVFPAVPKLYRHPVKFFAAESGSFLSDMQERWGGWAPFPRRLRGVAHMAFHVATLCGASPLVLLGFDLAYTGFRSHAPDMAVPVTINLDAAPWVEGIDGHMLPTMSQFVGTRTDLEWLIQESGMPCFNANRSGARINGAPAVELDALLASGPAFQADPAAVLARCFADSPRPLPAEVLALADRLAGECRTLAQQSQQAQEAVDHALLALRRDRTPPGRPRQGRTAKAFFRAIHASDGVAAAVNKMGFRDIRYLLSGQVEWLQAAERRLQALAHTHTQEERLREELTLLHRSMDLYAEAISTSTALLQRLRRRLDGEIRLTAQLAAVLAAPERAALLVALGRVYLDYGDLAEAEHALLAASALTGMDGEKTILLAQCRRRQYRFAEARELLAAADLPAGQPDLAAYMAEASAWLEKRLETIRHHIDLDATFVNLPLAITYCQDLLTWQPGLQGAEELLQRAQAKNARYEQSNALLVPILTLEEEPALARVEELLAAGEASLATRALMILCRKFPASGRLRERFALLHLDSGRMEEAQRLLVQAISLAPERHEGRIHLAALLAQQGELNEALGYLHQALALDPAGLAALNEGVGDLAAELGRHQEAIVAYERFFLAFPQRRDILRRMGYCYQQLGQQAAAQAAWQAAAP
ncbi:MAG: 6-hydroxymethylpterin diphosphokinase MptE-like protein [Thermodesulfobacteriota bacterium]